MNQKEKDKMKGVLAIIGGQEDGSKAFRKISKNLDDLALLNIKKQKKDRLILLLILPIFAIAITFAGYYAYHYWTASNNNIFTKECNLPSGTYTINIGGNMWDILQNPSNASQLFVAGYESGTVSIVDVKCTHKITENFAVGGHPASLSIGDNVLYISKVDFNEISVINTKKYEAGKIYYAKHS